MASSLRQVPPTAGLRSIMIVFCVPTPISTASSTFMRNRRLADGEHAPERRAWQGTHVNVRGDIPAEMRSRRSCRTAGSSDLGVWVPAAGVIVPETKIYCARSRLEYVGSVDVARASSRGGHDVAHGHKRGREGAGGDISNGEQDGTMQCLGRSQRRRARMCGLPAAWYTPRRWSEAGNACLHPRVCDWGCIRSETWAGSTTHR